LLIKIDGLKSTLQEHNQKSSQIEQENIALRIEKEKLAREKLDVAEELQALKLEKAQLEQKSVAGSSIIHTYTELRTGSIKCKTTNILYFKEISYVPYTNTLILMLMKFIKGYNKRAKLLIYDDRSGTSSVYKPLNIVGGKEFVANRDNYIANIESFVVLEPNPMILTSILTSIAPVFDVVIVYDRMHQNTNLVSGNNVVNFFVVNSSKDFKEMQNTLRILDKNSIITRPGSSLGNEVMSIPTIPEFHTVGESAQMSKYKILQSPNHKKSIINKILEAGRIRND